MNNSYEYRIHDSLANKFSKWKCNPPSPHLHEVFETVIKSLKRATSAIMSDPNVTDEKLPTAFSGAEALINKRPLTPQSADPRDNTPLTPNHFVFEQVGVCFASETVDE